MSLVDFLADRVLEAVADAPLLVPWADDDQPYESPLVERVAAIRARILELAERDGWKLDQAQLDDRRLVRRMILKRVVHGVDKNPMVVERAKVVLWLHTFTTGAPLSFLNHHLHCGDSLRGMRVYDAHRWLVDHGELYISDRVVPAQNAAEGMSRVELITDSDITEVEESAETFEGVAEATAPLNALLDLMQAERVMNVFDAAPARRPTAARPTTREKQAAYDRALALKNVFERVR